VKLRKKMSGKRDDLNDIQKEALKSLKESLIANNTLFGGDSESSSSSSIRIWGVELTKNSLDEKKEEIVLLKFLRARDFKVDASEKMFIDCIRWRKEFNLNELMEETFHLNTTNRWVISIKQIKKDVP